MQLLEKVKQNQTDAIYFVFGDDAYLMQEVKKTFIKSVVPEGERELNVMTFNWQDIDVHQLIEEALSMPFLSEKKLIIVNDFTLVTSEKNDEKAVDAIMSYVKNPSEETVLVLCAPYKTIDSRKKITKQLKKLATGIDVHSLSESETKQFVKQHLEQNNFKMDDKALQLLLEKVGFQLGYAMLEIEKLMLMHWNSKHITKETIEAVITPSLESSVFELVDNVLAKQSGLAVTLYRQLIRQKEDPIKILALFLSQFRLLIQMKVLLQKGYAQQDIAGYLKQHPYRIKQNMKHINRFSIEYLYELFDKLVQTDRALKSNVSDKIFFLEWLLITLSQ